MEYKPTPTNKKQYINARDDGLAEAGMRIDVRQSPNKMFERRLMYSKNSKMDFAAQYKTLNKH